MASERDKASGDEITSLLREIRDGQRELIRMAKEDRTSLTDQQAAWDEAAHRQRAELDADFKARKVARLVCVVAVCTGVLLIVGLTLASVSGWFD